MFRPSYSYQFSGALFGIFFSFHALATDLFESDTLLQRELASQPPGERLRVRVLQVGPLSVQAGQLLDVRFQIGVSTESEMPVMIGREVRFCNRPGQPCGHIAIPALATNISRQRHHEIIEGAALHRAPITTGQGYVSLYLWSNSEIPGKVSQIESKGALIQVLLMNDGASD